MSIIVGKDSEPFADIGGKGYHKHVIKRLTEHVEQNQGKLILLYRDIFGGHDGEAGCFHTPSALYTTHFEAGILDGVPYEMEANMGLNQISLTTGFSGRGSDTYMFSSGVAIPVRNKVASNFLPTSISELEKMSEKGQIEVGFLEFFSEKNRPGYTLNPPYLTTFALLFGEDEIRDFISNKMEKNSLNHFGIEGNLDEFLDLMQHPEKIQQKINISHHNARVKLATDLVQKVSNLTDLSGKLFEMREDVLGLYIYQEMDQDGPETYWSNLSTKSDYEDLRGDVLGQINSIRGILNTNGELDLRKLPVINGKILGFPSDINTKEYLEHIDEMIFPIEGVIGELSEHVAYAGTNRS